MKAAQAGELQVFSNHGEITLGFFLWHGRLYLYRLRQHNARIFLFDESQCCDPRINSR